MAVLPLIRLLARGCPRLHWFSWCLGVLAAALLGIILVPGEYLPVQHDGLPTGWDRQCRDFYEATYNEHRESVQHLDWPHVTVKLYEHGWPQPYMVRALVWKATPSGAPYRKDSEPLVQVRSYFTHWGGSLYHGASWSHYDSWPFSADGWIVRPLWLAIDLAVAAGLVALVCAAAEWRIRSRRGLFRFGVADLLGAITLIGLGLGYYTYHARIQAIESQGNGRPLPPGFNSHHGVMASGQSYQGPVWLRKLAGNPYYLRTLHHVDVISIQFEEHWQEAYASLPEHPYLRQFQAGGGLPLAGIEHLKRCPHVTQLTLPPLMQKPQPRRRPASRAATLTANDLALLAPLHLAAITMSGDAIGAAQVEQVAAFPAIRSIELRDVSATADELAVVRTRHPQVAITVLPSFKVFLSP